MSNILVDTSIWSEILRRRKTINLQVHKIMTTLIEDGRVSIIGPIRQEILSGIKEKSQFTKLKEHLKYFDDIEMNSDVYELAAEFNNTCRAKGVQGSSVDFLICAVASFYNMEIYTSDKDFNHYKKHLDIKLFDGKSSLK